MTDLQHCPRCTDAVVDLDEHLTWCQQPTETDALAAARALIEQDVQDRMSACLAEIEEVLDRYGMALTIAPARITITPA